MKISQQQVQQVARLFAAQARSRPVEKTEQSGAIQRPDKVELSRESREVQAAEQAIAQTPDVRTDVIRPIKLQIEAGTYAVKGRDVAEKMMARSIVDRLR